MNYENSPLDEDNQQESAELSEDILLQIPSNAFWTRLYAIFYLIINLLSFGLAFFILLQIPFKISVGIMIAGAAFAALSLWANMSLFSYSSKLYKVVKTADIDIFIEAMEQRKLYWQICVWCFITTVILVVIAFFFILAFLMSGGFAGGLR